MRMGKQGAFGRPGRVNGRSEYYYGMELGKGQLMEQGSHCLDGRARKVSLFDGEGVRESAMGG